MSQSYKEFAEVYDELMADIPYHQYAHLVELAAGGISGKKILDIGCGTGQLSTQLAKRGARVSGIDLSEEMLVVARERAKALSLPITFSKQPMQSFGGFANYDAAVIAIDAINYVINREEVVQTFRNIYDSLKVGGVLLFDVHSTFKIDILFMESPFTFDNERISYIWGTEEGEEPHSIYSELAFFVRQESGLYRRFDETHYQRTFEVHTYVAMLAKVGFSVERIFSDWEDEPPHEESERIFFQVRK